MIELDQTDRAILRALSDDGSLSAGALGRQLGLSQPATWRRIKRLQDSGVITQAGQRFEQLVKLPGFLEHIESAEGGDDTLAHLAVDAFVVNNLDVLIIPRLLDACEHRELRFRLPLRMMCICRRNSTPTPTRRQFLALRFLAIAGITHEHQRTYDNFNRQTVENGLGAPRSSMRTSSLAPKCYIST